MSNWTHTLTVIVPESLIPQGNQMALAVGTSEDDINTFQAADWTDGARDYAVANTVAVEQILDCYGAIDASDNPPLAEAVANTVFVGIDTDAGGNATITNNDPAKIRVIVDHEPLATLALLGLSRNAIQEP